MSVNFTVRFDLLTINDRPTPNGNIYSKNKKVLIYSSITPSAQCINSESTPLIPLGKPERPKRTTHNLCAIDLHTIFVLLTFISFLWSRIKDCRSGVIP